MATKDTHPATTGASLELGDIYYTLFRHKWKVLLCSVLGFVAAGAYYVVSPPWYKSEAKLFIRYVVTEGKTPGPGHEDMASKSPEAIIRSEVEILNSLDLAEAVAKNIGPERILAKAGGGSDLIAAAVIIKKNLVIEVPPASSVIRLELTHPDPEIAQAALRELVESYMRKHVEIHRAVGIVGDFLTQETDQLRSRLAQTEEELRKTTNRAGVISLEDSKKSFGEQIGRIREQVFDAQAELAERSSVLQEMTKGSPVAPSETEALPPPTPEQANAYQQLVTKLTQLKKREQEYLVNFTEESTRVREVRNQIADTEDRKKKMEAEFPGLRRLPVAAAIVSSQMAGTYNPAVEAAQITALQAKIKVLNGQLDEVKAEAAKVDELAINILELRRRKELEEANYRYYSASLEQSRINEALGAGRVSNISQIQTPSPAFKDWGKKQKLLIGIAIGGIGFGLGWAFLIELYLDRTIRRPADVERVLGLPLFLSIPKVAGRIGMRKVPQLPPPKPDAAATGSQLVPAAVNGDVPALTAFHETLRDRLISYFDTLNVRHKPKLVAVTGLGRDAGVTTLAAGLARSFSETGEGNVLLVDMTQGQGSAQHFHKGANVVGLEQLLDTKNSAQVNDHLFVVSENSNSERLAKGMPQRFNQLIPKLKASDFDYIIFDMPPVNQISITPRLASFMDMMLMVLESEKTDRDMALHASALLAKSRAPVGVVLNKTKSYIPPSLHQDREFLLGT